VPVSVNYLPVFGPDDAAEEGISLPWSRDDSFIIGFAGLLSEQKGWKVLLEAVERLPYSFKVVLAGDGEQRSELEAWLKRPNLQGRAFYAGLLPKRQLLATFPLLDVLVLPSITTSYSVEQFGAVLAEAMACGVPVIGSDSGAIPETVGQAGLIFPEGDSDALTKAIVHLSNDEEGRWQAIANGLENFRNIYCCEIYSRSIADLLKIE
jgi:glycosyltransferase involved in cell wall biosynthesis